MMIFNFILYVFWMYTFFQAVDDGSTLWMTVALGFGYWCFSDFMHRWYELTEPHY